MVVSDYGFDLLLLFARSLFNYAIQKRSKMEMNPNFSANAQNDFNLIRLALNGDQKAYTSLMQRYERTVYFLVFKMVGNKADAEDLTVEIFAKVFENLGKYKADFAFSSWLFKIASNYCVDFIRKGKLQTISLNALTDNCVEFGRFQIKSDTLNPEEKSIKKQRGEEMKIIIDQLPMQYAKLISMRFYDELTYSEIASKLDCPVGTVKAQLYRAKDLILQILNLKSGKLYCEF